MLHYDAMLASFISYLSTMDTQCVEKSI